MVYREIGIEDTDLVRTVTIKRENPLNPITIDLLSEIQDAVNNSGERIIVITGSNKAFSAGADIRGFMDIDSAKAYSFAMKGHEIMNFFNSYPRPIIAAIHGFALGGGFELALACDMRVAHPSTIFGLPEITLGILPGFGGTQRLTKIAGEARAMDLIGRGLRFSAQEAMSMGIVNYITEDYLGKSMEIAVDFASKPIQSLKFVKHLVRSRPDDMYSMEAEYFARSFDHPDRKAGISAFLEKKPARFAQRKQ
ncbi:MAG: enoyl-CoA hydratase-related protein [Thermoplasmataceae archaeon]